MDSRSSSPDPNGDRVQNSRSQDHHHHYPHDRHLPQDPHHSHEDDDEYEECQSAHERDSYLDHLNDHRNQPDSLPIRTSFNELRKVPTNRSVDSNASINASRVQDNIPLSASIDVASATAAQKFPDRLRSHSMTSNGLYRSRSRASRGSRASSCAISDSDDDNIISEKVGGILLNGKELNIKRKSSRRMTRGSILSSVGANSDLGSDPEEENGSRASLGDQTEEDVCFPMIKTNERTGIDFEELEDFAVSSSRGAYSPKDDAMISNRKSLGSNRYQTNHRPLVPQAMAIQSERLNNSSPSADSPDSQPASDVTKIGIDLDEKINTDASLHLGPIRRLKSRFQEYDPEPANPYQHEQADLSFGHKRRSSVSQDRFSFFAADSDETVHAPNIPSLIDEGQSFKDLFNDSDGTWWLDCLDPTDAEMRALSKAFGIHPLTAEDIRTEESREKVELFQNYYFVCFHTFDADPESEDFLEPINMYIVVFKDGILSFHFSPVQHNVNVRRRIRQLRDYVSVSADWICYALIDDITDSFAPIIHEIEVETDVIEDSVFVARESDFGHLLRRIGEARRKVMTLLRLLSGKADVIKMFAKRCNEQWDNAPKGEIGLYLGDIQDHIITMYQNLSAYEKIFSRSHANYLAQLQVESVSSNNRVTQVLGKATIIGTVLVPMNLVTGLFGMNVTVPGEQQGTVAWFFGIVGFILLMVVILGLLAKRWLDGAEVEVAGAQSSGRSIRSSAASILSRRSRNSRNPNSSRV